MLEALSSLATNLSLSVHSNVSLSHFLFRHFTKQVAYIFRLPFMNQIFHLKMSLIILPDRLSLFDKWFAIQLICCLFRHTKYFIIIFQ